MLPKQSRKAHWGLLVSRELSIHLRGVVKEGLHFPLFMRPGGFTSVQRQYPSEAARPANWQSGTAGSLQQEFHSRMKDFIIFFKMGVAEEKEKVGQSEEILFWV